MLAFGPPGSGKTTGAEFVISGMYNIPLSDVQEATILGNPELTEEKMLAYVDLRSFLRKEEIIGVRKFMKNRGRIIDEANRMPSSKSSILLNILDRGWAIYNSQKITAEPGALFATVNGADSGNYDMTPAFLDRFDVAIVTANLNPWYVELFSKKRSNKIRFQREEIVVAPERISDGDISRARKEIYLGTQFEDGLLDKFAYFLAELDGCFKAGKEYHDKHKGHALTRPPGPLCEDCHFYNTDTNICLTTENSISARTLSSLWAYSKALSWWRGSNVVEEQDLKYILGHVSWFKLVPTRTGTDLDETFVNDRKAFVYQLWDSASRSFEEAVQICPTLKGIMHTITHYNEPGFKRPSRPEIKDMMNQLEKFDSVAAYPLATTLNSIYVDNGSN
jgi:MoxR-like ATPase